MLPHSDIHQIQTSTICWGCFLFPIVWFGALCFCKSSAHMCEGLFLGIQSYFIDHHVCFFTNSMQFLSLLVCNLPWCQGWWFLQCSFIIQNHLNYLEFLVFTSEFKNFSFFFFSFWFRWSFAICVYVFRGHLCGPSYAGNSRPTRTCASGPIRWLAREVVLKGRRLLPLLIPFGLFFWQLNSPFVSQSWITKTVVYTDH